jgi:hypothetical protein
MIEVTRQGETWDMISFRLLNNEYYGDQLQKANPLYNQITIFDAGVRLTVPAVIIKVSVSNVVWGGITQIA